MSRVDDIFDKAYDTILEFTPEEVEVIDKFLTIWLKKVRSKFGY